MDRPVFQGALIILSVIAIGCEGDMPANPAAPSEAALQSERMVETYLSDWQWVSARNGWGPVERDRSNGERGSDDGNPLTIDGRTYPKGLGTHPYSALRYTLDGTCTTFTADIGIDDEVGDRGAAVFSVWGDGLLMYESPLITGTSKASSVTLSISGVDTLTLEVDSGGDSDNYDHADWADARVTCVSPN